MQSLSIFAAVVMLGVVAAAGAQAEEFVVVPGAVGVTLQAPKLGSFSALADPYIVHVDRQASDDLWKGAGVAGNPNGN